MIISKYFVFVHIPKTGGIFINKLFTDTDEFKCLKCYHKKEYQHKSISWFLQNTDIGNKHWFYVVRNPWAWHFSQFRYVKARINSNSEIKIRMYPSLYSNKQLDEKELFSLFIQDKINGYNNDFLDSTISGIIDQLPERITVLRLENLQHGLMSFLSQFINLTLDQILLISKKEPINVTNPSRLYNEYYNEKTRNYILSKESFIINRYGYTFNESV